MPKQPTIKILLMIAIFLGGAFFAFGQFGAWTSAVAQRQDGPGVRQFPLDAESKNPPADPNSDGGGGNGDGGIAGGAIVCLYKHDDGIAESAAGVGGGQMAWANQFETSASGICQVIDNVQVAFAQNPPNGTPGQIYVLSDSNQDGNPTDAVVLSTANINIANAGTNIFNIYPIAPTQVSGKFFIAVRVLTGPSDGPARLDTTPPISNKSWIAFNFSNPNAPFTSGGTLTQITNGDWLVRAGGSACSQLLPYCAPDINGDGVINVDDLLALLASWGQNTFPNGPRPAGDLAPQPSGDCLVNVDDLLSLLAGWGTCPDPTGACCLSGGICSGNQTLAGCAAAGGTYQGDFSSCLSAQCPNPPANDLCADAATAANGANPWNNTDASTDGPAGAPKSCEANIGRDIWFNYTATCNGVVTIDTEGSSQVTDTVLAVYDTWACPPGSLLACNDDISFPANLLSSVSVPVIAGQQLKIRVGSWQTSGATGAGTLNISCTSNDMCTGAAPIAIGSSITDTLQGAMLDSPPTCNGVSGGFGRWFAVMGDGTTLTASTCLSQGGGFNTALSVYCGVNCFSLSCVTAANNNSCGAGPLHEQVSWCSIAGQMYWILVHTPTSPGAATFTLQVTSNGTPCSSGTCAPLVANDFCSGAIDLTPHIDGASYFGNNTNATPASGGGADPQLPAGSPSCHWLGAPSFVHNTVWFRFTAPAGGAITIETCSSSQPFNDSILALYSGACGSLVQVACDEETCTPKDDPFHARLTATGLTPGATYRLMLGNSGGWLGSVPGAYRIDLSTGITPPPSCPACVGSPENLPCQVNGNPVVNDPNGGCNSTPPQFSNISVGQTICGIGSTYITAGQGWRDTDWYLFTASVSGSHTITVCASFPVTAGFITNGTNVLSNCSGTLAWVGGTPVNGAANQVHTLTRTLVAGRQYAVFVSPQAGPSVACPPAGQTNYSVKLTQP